MATVYLEDPTTISANSRVENEADLIVDEEITNL